MCIALLTTALSTAPADAATGRCPQWEPLFRKWGLPVKEFSRIAWRESRCNPKSVSKVRSTGYPDVGLLQIQGSWATLTGEICGVPRKRQRIVLALTDPVCNVKVATYLYDNGGLGHWRVGSGK